MKKIFFVLCLFAFSVFTPSSNYSQGFLSLEPESDEIQLITGEVNVFSVSNPQRVSIRNPEIADIAKVSDTEVVIIAKHTGETALTLWDSSGERVYFIIVYSQNLKRVTQKLKRLINKNLGIDQVYYRINEATGKIMVLGEVTAEEKAQIENVLAYFYDEGGSSVLIDNVLTVTRESRMVEIDCEILEINKNDLDEIGVKWLETLQMREETYTAPSGTSAGVETTLDRIAPWTALWPMHNFSRDAFHAKLRFLERRNKAKILSRPKLLCLSGEEAKLVVGGEVPYVTASTTNATGTGVEISYKEYGVILSLRPEVLKDGKVAFNIGTEVSSLDWSNAITVSDIQVPAFATRKADTVLNVTSGDTIFIGGLIKNEESHNVDMLPALGRIPILGILFKSKDFQDDRTELVITLTPVIRESKGESQRQQAMTPQPDKPAKLAIYPRYLQDESVLEDYILRVQKRIFENLNYPPLAKEAGWQGTVRFKMHLNAHGEVMEIRVVQSSGYVSFDENVTKTARSLSPYSPFPPNIDLEELWVDIPIVYKMD